MQNPKLFKGSFAVVLSVFFFFAVMPISFAEEAEQTAQKPVAKRTKEIVISATRTEKDLFDVSASTAVVSQRQLETEPKATIAEALQDIPGVQVYDQGMGGGAKRVAIRGESGKRVLILIDGMKVSEQKSLEGAMLLLDTNNVERIEVIKGPASVLYGSEAIGGVINVITKKGGDRPVQFGSYLTYDSTYNSFTPYETLYGKIRNVGYRFSGDFTQARDKRAASGKVPHSAYRMTNTSAYLDYSWDKGKVGAGYDFYRSRIENPTVVERGIVERNGRRGGATTTVELDLPKWERERFYGLIELEDLSTHLKKLQWQGFISKIKKDFTNLVTVRVDRINAGNFWLDQDIISDIFIRNDQVSYGSTLQSDWSFGDHYVVAGLDFLQDKLDADDIRNSGRLVNSSNTRLNGFFPNRNNGKYVYSGRQDSYSAFLQDEWLLHEDWTLTLGARGTWIESKLEKNNAGLKNESETGKNVSFSAGLSYSGFEDWNLRAHYAQGYRFPTLQELYIGTPHGTSGVTLANSSLSPEKSQSYELGARYSANGINLDTSVYYTHAKDYIYRALVDRESNGRYENADKAKTYGVELNLSYTFEGLGLTPYLQGTWMERKQESQRLTTKKTGDPQLAGRAGVRYEWSVTDSTKVTADAFTRFAGRAKEESIKDSGKKTTREYAGWGTANFAVGMLIEGEQKFFADINFNNILNNHYTQAGRFNSIEEPGFNVLARVGVEF